MTTPETAALVGLLISVWPLFAVVMAYTLIERFFS